MMYLSILVCIIFFIAFILIVMNIVEGIIRTKNNERLLCKVDKIIERDKVVTRTGGLAHDRIYDNIDKDDFNARVAEEYQKAFKITLEDAKESLGNKKK